MGRQVEDLDEVVVDEPDVNRKFKRTWAKHFPNQKTRTTVSPSRLPSTTRPSQSELSIDTSSIPVDRRLVVISEDIYPEQNVYDWNNTIPADGCYSSRVDEDTGELEPEDGTGALSHTSTVEPVFVTSEAQNFAHSLVGNVRTSKVPLNDLHDTDVESIDSIETVETSVRSGSAPVARDGYGVPCRPKQEDISDFHLAFGLWCDKEGITRLAYNGLIEALRLINDVVEVHTLPRSLTTLRIWCRDRLPLPTLRKTVVAVRTAKQPSGLANSSQCSMYFYDMRVLLATILSTTKGHVFHTGMADIVDNPSEYWHSRSWGSSVRTCSQDYILYPDSTPVIPSDFVDHLCNSVECGTKHNRHLGQVVFFGRDRRSNSIWKDSVLLEIRPVEKATDLLSPHEILSSEIQWTADEHVLIELDKYFIQPHQLLCRRSDVNMQRSFPISLLCSPRHGTTSIRYVLNASSRKIRSLGELSPTRGELEIATFGRDFLTSQLLGGIKSFPMVIFVDAFGLYRNMYRSLTGVYAMPTGLSRTERQKSRNCYTLTLGPHGSEFNDVARGLHTGMKALDSGCVLMINGVNTLVWAPVMAYLGDMKQQQESAGFLGPRATRSCRFCDAETNNRGDLERDTITHGRYHHQVAALRKEATSIPTLSQRRKFFSEHGLAHEASALADISPALDTVLSFPPDPAHSEYYGLVRQLYPIIGKHILTPKSFLEFNTNFQRFPFPPGWGRIQSPATHMGSWSMSECGKASIIIPMLFRCWLKRHHVRKSYLTGVTRELSSWDPMGLTAVDSIVFGFGRLAKSNSLISAFELSDQDRRSFHEQIVNARRWVLLLMNAATNEATEATKQPRKRKQPKTKRRKVLPPNPAPTSSGIDSEASATDIPSQRLDGVEELGGDADQKAKLISLPNFHIGIHFERLMQEYGVVWNANVLFGEDKHRFFKKTVLCTNHQKPERQLLLKEAVNLTVRAVLDGAFLHTDTKVTSQLRHIQQQCPNLLREYVPDLEADSDADVDDMKGALSATASHIRPAVRGRLKRAYLSRAKLSSKLSQVCHSDFCLLMRFAMDAYGVNASHWGKEPLNWYEGYSFTSSATSKRVTFHVGDFAKLTSGELVQVRQIYTHAFKYENVRRLFVWVQILRPAHYQDTVLQLDVYKATTTAKIVPFFSICDEKVYVIPVATANNCDGDPSSPDLLHCSWKINFL